MTALESPAPRDELAAAEGDDAPPSPRSSETTPQKMPASPKLEELLAVPTAATAATQTDLDHAHVTALERTVAEQAARIAELEAQLHSLLHGIDDDDDDDVDGDAALRRVQQQLAELNLEEGTDATE